MINEGRIIPDFVIIGAMKAGTSTLHRNLLHHPTIGMSKNKEPNYFNKNFSNGLNWYSCLFEEGFQCYGETSPNYAKLQECTDTAKNIYDTNPEIKIIYVVRDPIDRLVSHLHHDLYRDRLKLKDISNMSFANTDYLKTSNYFYQILEFLKYFRKENIKILFFEKLIKDPNMVLNELCDYLKQPNFNFKTVLKAYNTTENKYWIYKYDLIHDNFIKKIAKLYNMFFYVLSRKINKPVLTKGQQIQIRSLLAKDMHKFKETFNINIDEWETYNSLKLDE